MKRILNLTNEQKHELKLLFSKWEKNKLNQQQQNQNQSFTGTPKIEKIFEQNQSFSEPPSAQDLTPVVYGVGIVSKPDSVEMKQEPLGKDTDVVKVFDERLKTTGDNVQTMEYSNKKCNHFSVAYEGHITYRFKQSESIIEVTEQGGIDVEFKEVTQMFDRISPINIRNSKFSKLSYDPGGTCFFDEQGKLLGYASSLIQIWKECDCIEQSATDIWNAVSSVVKLACLHAKVEREEVKSLSVKGPFLEDLSIGISPKKLSFVVLLLVDDFAKEHNDSGTISFPFSIPRSSQNTKNSHIPLNSNENECVWDASLPPSGNVSLHGNIDSIGVVTVMSIVNRCNRTYKSDDVTSDGMFSMDRSCCKSIKGSVRAYSIENAKTGVSRARDSIGLSGDNNSVCEKSNFVAPMDITKLKIMANFACIYRMLVQLVLEPTFTILSVNHVVLDEIVRSTLYNYELEMHVEDENDPSLLTREEMRTPKVCAQIYVQRMVELVKESTTLHQVLDPMLMYFDSEHHWIFQHGLLMEDLFDMSYRNASGSQQLILVAALISALNHWELMNETGAGLMAETYKLKGSRNNELGVAVWVALLSDCCNHGKSSIGKMVAKMVLELNPDILEIHALASKFFAKKNMWGEVSFVRKLMKDSKKNKVCGYTTLDVNMKLHAFLMRDNGNNFVALLVSCWYWKFYKTISMLESSLFDPWGQGSFEGRRNVMTRKEANNGGKNEEVRAKEHVEVKLFCTIITDFSHEDCEFEMTIHIRREFVDPSLVEIKRVCEKEATNVVYGTVLKCFELKSRNEVMQYAKRTSLGSNQNGARQSMEGHQFFFLFADFKACCFDYKVSKHLILCTEVSNCRFRFLGTRIECRRGIVMTLS
ncbi:hypothetical protein GQ457_14G003360 [Hibiscus cannabinus]